jgi:tetratricopeptide (TPR) repeat protein
LARVYLDWGRTSQALNAVSAAEQLGAEAVELERLRARIHLRAAETAAEGKLSHWRAVVDHGQRLLRFASDDRQASRDLARAYLHLRMWDAAHSLYEGLLVSDPGDPVVRERLGALLLFDDPEALKHLYVSGTDLARQLLAVVEDGATMTEPAYGHARVARVLIEHQEWALAARQLERALDHHPTYGNAHAYLGHALDQMGHRVGAREHLLRAVELAPASTVAHTFLGLYYDRRGDTAAARAEYETAYDLAPENPGICVEIGQTWATEGRYAEAEIWLREAVSLRPNDSALWEVLARFYLNHNITSNDRAVEAAERLLELAPDSAEAHHLRGWAALQMGAYRSAEEHLRRAIELDAELASAHYHLGLLRQAQGRGREAELAFDRAIDLDTSGTLLPLVERAR